MTDTTPIPLVDLRSQHDEVADRVAAGFAAVLADTAFIGGPAVASFEAAFAAFCGTAHCVGTANGTDAIEIALRGLGIGRGDEVIAPANTFIATIEAIDRSGATPVLADCDPATMLVDPERVAGRVTGATRAVVGVDLYGQIAPFEQLAEAVPDHVVLVEDAAQSQGATRHGRPVGSGVAVATTSFYPGKNLGAYGDAGAVVTHDPSLADLMRAIGDHGGRTRYQHDVVGFNSRLDALQAVVLEAKLERLPVWNDLRRAAARRYDELLAGADRVVLPVTAAGNEHVWHLYVVQVPDRDRVLGEMHAAGVGAGLHYPVPVHLTPAFSHLPYGPGGFPVAESLASGMLSLPMFPHITAPQQERVVDVLTAAISGA